MFDVRLSEEQRQFQKLARDFAQNEIKPRAMPLRSEEHTSELQSRLHIVCRLLLEKTKSGAKPYYLSDLSLRTTSRRGRLVAPRPLLALLAWWVPCVTPVSSGVIEPCARVRAQATS